MIHYHGSPLVVMFIADFIMSCWYRVWDKD